MIFYSSIKCKPVIFKCFTGLDVHEFDELLSYFEKAWHECCAENLLKNKDRQRNPGAGNTPNLNTHEDRLFFILVYFKLYTLQTVLGYLFGMSQGRANEWIERLSYVLKRALDLTGDLPARDEGQAKSALSNSATCEFTIDGTERRRQRPMEPEKQKEYYSGKKKAHSVKNNVIVDNGQRRIIYLSPTVAGKVHDKSLADDSGVEFPSGSTLLQDTGFQGYEPPGAVVLQPKKKPRGKELTPADRFVNQVISKTRIIVEHVISGIKRSRIVKDVFRNTRDNYDDLVMEIACGLHNFRSRHRNAQEKLTPIFSAQF
jgi:hypothetical protein